MKNKSLYRSIWKLALPITLQCLFQASFSLIDQIMVGQLGSVSIAGSGLGGKFASIYIVIAGAIGAVASIMISQYHGTEDDEGINKSFFTSFFMALIAAIIFTVISFFFAERIMGLYTLDMATQREASRYLKIISLGFLPVCVTTMLSSWLRSMGESRYPMYAGFAAVLMNIAGNYILIFGKLGFAPMGLAGAAISTSFARFLEMIVVVWLFFVMKKRGTIRVIPHIKIEKTFWIKTGVMALPLFLNEFLWSLGENIYSMIYGRIGTDACAAMTLTGAIQMMFVGGFTGISTAAGVMVGRSLGKNQFEEAFQDSRRFVKIGVGGSLGAGFVILLFARQYVSIFPVGAEIKTMTVYILYAFASVLAAKVTNMILAGGILRSGGNTKYTLYIDILGTWVFGIPLGLLAAYIFRLPIYWVYFILSMEEWVRVIAGVIVFKRRKWMRNIT